VCCWHSSPPILLRRKPAKTGSRTLRPHAWVPLSTNLCARVFRSHPFRHTPSPLTKNKNKKTAVMVQLHILRITNREWIDARGVLWCIFLFHTHTQRNPTGTWGMDYGVRRSK
jgi:hypothetical protein